MRSIIRRLLLPPVTSSGVVFRTTLIVGLGQLVGLLMFDFGHDAAGHPLQVSIANALMLQIPLYACGLLIPASLWLFIHSAVPRAQRAINTIAVLIAALLVVVSQIDFGMQRFRGERVSAAQLATYLGPNAVNSDWIDPVLEQPLPVVASALLLCVSLFLLARVAFASGVKASSRRISLRGAVLCALAAIACYLPTRFAYQPQRDIALSPQAVLLQPFVSSTRDWYPERETVTRDRFRTAIDIENRGGWLSDSFPLWRNGARSPSPSFGAARNDPPDIVVFMIESLRGHDVSWGYGQRGNAPSLTPHLDSLAQTAITFPHYIANGEPSPRGYITLHTGAWEHEHDFIIANHPDIALDAIPLRLRDFGYHTIALWGGNPSFDNQLTWGRRWYDDVVFDLPGNRMFYFHTMPDHVLMNRVIENVSQHDRLQPQKPLFMMVYPAHTHTPYELETDAEVAADNPPSSDRQQRYNLVLRNVDAGIGRVIAKLRARGRWDNTIVIVTGDHSDRTTEETDPRWRGLPTDAAVATAALIAGPSRLIGAPRALVMPASHADLMPTILAWLGDTTPVTTLGRDLLDTTAADRREAVSVSGRGYRIDRGDFTLLVDRDNPQNYVAWRAFQGEKPTLLQLSDTPFAADEPNRLAERILYWSHLVEGNRVRPPLKATGRPAKP